MQHTLDNIIISNKAFEENAAKSSVLVSHTSTTIEQWLPTSSYFKVKGISSPYLDTTETLESDLYIVDNQDVTFPHLETISKKLVRSDSEREPTTLFFSHVTGIQLIDLSLKIL